MNEKRNQIHIEVRNLSNQPITVHFNENTPVLRNILPETSTEFSFSPSDLTEDCLQFFCRIQGKEFGYLTDFLNPDARGQVRFDVKGLADSLNLMYEHRADWVS